MAAVAPGNISELPEVAPQPEEVRASASAGSGTGLPDWAFGAVVGAILVCLLWGLGK